MNFGQIVLNIPENIMKFSDLNFQQHPSFKTGVQALHFFPNGYGVSVVKNEQSYGGKEGLYEVAILKGDEKRWQICYETIFTDDVLGWQSTEDVTDILHALEKF